MRSLLLLSTLLLVGCPNGGDTEETDLDTDTDSDTDTDVDTDTDPAGSLVGDLVDEQGAGLDSAIVQMCSGGCRQTTADSTGHYEFESLPPGIYTYIAVPPDGRDLTHPCFPVTIAVDVETVVDLTLPDVAGWTSLTGSTSEIEIAPELFIDVKQGDLTIPFEDDPAEVGGALVDLADYPTDLGITGNIVALWYLVPHKAEADPQLTVRMDNAFSLTVGDTYELWLMSYDDMAFLKVGDFTADAVELTATSGSLDHLQTVVLIDPS